MIADAFQQPARGNGQVAPGIGQQEGLIAGRAVGENCILPGDHFAATIQHAADPRRERRLGEHGDESLIGLDGVIGDHEIIGGLRLLVLQPLFPLVGGNGRCGRASVILALMGEEPERVGER
jgi:hypothetical protein